MASEETDQLIRVSVVAHVVAHQRSLTIHLPNAKEQIKNLNQKFAAAQDAKVVVAVECQVTLRFPNASILNSFCKKLKF